jgi:hypothetical protein
MPKVDQKAWTSFGKKEREKVVRGRKKNKNNKDAPYSKSREKAWTSFRKNEREKKKEK